nr:hypothetical protein [Clostridia bacterium]
MSKKYELFPNKGIGELFFGMTRDEVQQLLGNPISSIKYGFPIQDSILDDYVFFYTMFSNKGVLEAVEFFPQYTKEKIIWNYGDSSIQLTANRETMLEGLNSFTDDLIKDEDEDASECYCSKKLGVKFFYPEDEENDVLSVIVYAPHYYDEK